MCEPASTPITVPPTQAGKFVSETPIMNGMSKRPPARTAIAHETSTMIQPVAALRARPPRTHGAIASPIGTKRRFRSTPAITAAVTLPPAARTASIANCAEPAKIRTDEAMVAAPPSTGRATTP